MIVFLDLEASSLDADSWPVEVGMAWPAEGRLEARSSLIRPDPSWSMRAWSPASAQVHGIPLAELRQAPPAPEVARWVAGIVGDATLVSDAPEFLGSLQESDLRVRWMRTGDERSRDQLASSFWPGSFRAPSAWR